MIPKVIQTSSNLHRLSIFSLTVLILLILLIIALLSAVPPVSRDALTHHLYVPKLYVDAGGIVELPWIPFSYYPMNLDLLYAIPLMFGNDIMPKYIHFLFALFTAGFLYRYLTRRFDKLYGLFGVFFFLSIPVVIKLSTTVYVDLGLICFTTASLLALAEWRENGFLINKLIISGIFCGLALGTKYNGLVTFFLLVMMVPVIYLRSGFQGARSQLKAIRNAFLFAMVALLVFSPWMIRNIAWTGNPVYPLYKNVFKKSIKAPADRKISKADDEAVKQSRIKLNHLNIRSIIYGESTWEIGTIPIRVFFQGKDDNPKYFDGVLSPWLVLFPLGLLIRRQKGEKRPGASDDWMFFGFAMLYLLIVFFKQDMRIRWISPIIPSLVILSTGGLNRIAAFVSRRWPGTIHWKDPAILGVATVCILLTSAPYVQSYFQKVVPLEYLMGKIGRNDYILRYRPEYATIRYANEHLEDSSKLLGVYLGNRGYYFENPVVFANYFIEAYVNPFGQADQIHQKIVKDDIQYLLVNYALLNRRMSESLNGDQQRMVQEFFTLNTKLLHSELGYGLYQLL